jgi:hypothetical protein
MIRFGTVLLGLGLWLPLVGTSHAFSLIGAGFPAWQTADYDNVVLAYDQPGDIGGPREVSEGYRWNLPLITYAFDQSFINYFGFDGIRAVEQAIRVYQGLPPMNQIPTDGFSFFINGEPVPFRTTLENQDARGMGLLDLKSTAMHYLIEELGLAEPERYAWTLGSREVIDFDPDPDATNYVVFNLNFDPITLRRTNMVNGVLYGYNIFEFANPDTADAFETFDPLATIFANMSVAGGRSVLTAIGGTIFIGNQAFFFGNAGRFYTGLTHDDVGGLRWLYHPRNFAVENLETNVVLGTPVTGRGSPWTPFFGGTNVVIGTNVLFNTNVFVREGVRAGMNDLRFQRVNYDSLIGRIFVPITNRWVDQFITNGQVTIQPVQRVITQPDIVFTAERLGLDDNFFPFLVSRSPTDNWQNNDSINGIDVEVDGGPGVIQPPVRIRFTDQLPFFFNTTQFLIGQPIANPSNTNITHIQSVIWGSFDETATPIIYPQYGSITLQDLRRFAVGGGN